MQGGCWVGPNCVRVFKWSSLEYLEFRLVVECSNLVKWMMNWSRTFWIDCGFGYGPHPHFVCSLFYFHLLLPMQTKEWGERVRLGWRLCVLSISTLACVYYLLVTSSLMSFTTINALVVCLFWLEFYATNYHHHYFIIVKLFVSNVGIHGTRLVLRVAFVLTLYMTWISHWYMTKCARHCWHYTLP